MSKDFTGLSYETAQLGNPEFFSPSNARLIELFQALSPDGVLRLGGNLSDYSFWSDTDAPHSTAAELEQATSIRDYYEWKLVDSVAAERRYTAITPRAIRNLAGFLERTGWRLIYGLNLGSGTAERAAREAECVHRNVGSKLIAFQAGNEADFFAPRHRDKPFTFDRYWAEYQDYVNAVRARVPGAPFAGPDVAAHMDWVSNVANKVNHDAVLLTGHYYAMGPAEDPTMNAERLLRRDPRLAKQIEIASQAAALAGVPFRMTEGNSCFHGGKPGVSDAYASALWVADYMLFLAESGYRGVNLHGGGNGTYTPIAGDREKGFSARPIYSGMQFAQQFAGGRFLETQIESEGLNIAAYAVRKGNTGLLGVVNKEATALQVKVKESGLFIGKPAIVYGLSGPTLDATSDVVFGKEHGSHIRVQDGSLFISVGPYAGVIAAFT